MPDHRFPHSELRELAQTAADQIGDGWGEEVFDVWVLNIELIGLLESYASGWLSDEDVVHTCIDYSGRRTRYIVSEFIKMFFHEIRNAICGDAGSQAVKAADLSAKGVASALAASLVNSVPHLSGPVALGLATVTLIVIGEAAKSAFCQMTQEEVLKEVGRPRE